MIRFFAGLRSKVSRKALVGLAVLAVFLAAFWGGAYVSETVFDGLPHVEDEHAFLFQAKVFATARLYVSSPEYPDFFPTQFVIDHDGKRFGKYPPGYPAVLSLGVIAGQPRLVNPLLGALGLAVVFLIGRELYGTATGLLAAALGLASPFFLMQSGSFMSHSTGLFFLSLFILFYIKANRSNSILFPLLAGASLGMAFITRQLTAFGLAFPFVVYALIDLRHGWRVFLRYGLMALAFVPFAVFLLYFNYALTGDPFSNPYELWWDFDRVGFGPREDLWPTLAGRWSSTLVNISLLSDYLFGWPARLSLAFLIVPFFLLTRKLGDWLLLSAAVSLAVVYMAYWTSGEMYGPRYFYEALPMLLILTARGVMEGHALLTRLARRWQGDQPPSSPERIRRKIASAARFVWKRVRATTAHVRPELVSTRTQPAHASSPGGVSRKLRLMNLNEIIGCHSPGSEASAGKGAAPAEASDPGDTVLPEQITEVHKPELRLLGRQTASYPNRLGVRGKASLASVAPTGAIIVLLLTLVYTGLTGFLAQEMAHYKGWYGVTAVPLDEVKRAGLSKALVFVSTASSWTEFAAVDVANSPDYDSNVVFAADQDGKNAKLIELYPDRSYYRMVGASISPYAISK